MDKPLFSDCCTALEYTHLFVNKDNINFYSAKIDDAFYIMVDDYDFDAYSIWSEMPIVFLANDRLLCKQEEKYGVVNAEGLIIIPFVYNRFENRGYFEGDRFNVLLDNKWGVIDLSGREIFRIKYNNPIPLISQFYKMTEENVCRNAMLVEDACTHRQGLVDINGYEIVPTIYSKIEKSESRNYVYVSWGYVEEGEFGSEWNGVWGCYNWQGQEIIPVQFHAIHYINGYFIAGDDGYVSSNDNFTINYYGLYDLYDSEGNMVIGGFSKCHIRTNCIILNFGIAVDYRRKKTYWNKDIEYGEKLVPILDFDKICTIIIDKELKSYIPRHLVEETNEEIIYEYDFLSNNLPKEKGLLIGEYPMLRKGKRYSENDKIIKGICVHTAFSISDNVVIYSPYRKIETDDYSMRLKGIIFCNESKIIPPIYRDVKLFDGKLLFIRDQEGLIGIRNVVKELLVPQFNLITNPYNNLAIGFIIEYVEEKENYQCQCYLLRYDENAVGQESIAKITGSQLLELLYPVLEQSSWNTIGLSDEHKALVMEYWKHISHNNSFWYPPYEDFRYLRENEYCDEVRENNSDGLMDFYSWEYYNDGLDMDQQDERFWNF